MEQSNRERQEEELQVLQAIFMNEFEDLRSSLQIESGSPPAIRLKLTPLHSIMRQEVHAKVDLVVRYTTRYPTDPPLLRLENAKGLSKEQISSLKKGLDLQAKELIGEVMVLQLAQSVQAFLHKHNIPTLSFHEQMLKNMQKEKDLREKETEKRLAKDKAQAKEFDDDVTKMVKAALQEREEAMKEERKRRQQFEENRTESTELGNDAVLGTSPGTNWRRRNADSTERIDVSMETKPSGRRESLVCTRITQPVAIISFTGKLGDREVYCGKCVNHNFQGACTRSGLDLKSGEIVSVCEWILRSKKTKRKPSIIASGNLDTENVYQQVSGMEQELSYLSNKLQHPNLVQYHSIRIEMNEDFVTTRILMDYLEGSSLADSISHPGMPIDVLKDYTKQLVQVLNYLHSKSIVHRDLQPSHVFISNGNVLKVSGYAVLRRLSDLYNLLQNEAAEQGEFADYRKLVKPGKKGDIFNLGLVVLSLAQGKIATGYPVEIPAGLPEDLLDFLLKCLNIDEKERWSAPQLVKHSFLIVQSMPYNINNSQVNDSVQDAGQGEGANDEANFLYSLSALNIPNKTRLLTDFEILESLGKGGFGDVIKARKKLDGLLYAIKRINLNPKSAQLKKRIIREVKLLSRLNHENVVRYYSSWIEAEEISSSDMKSSEAESESDNKQRKRTTSSQTKEEEEEDSLLKYNNFEAPSINVEVNDEDISWCEDEIKRESDVSYADTSSSSSSSDDDDGDRVGSLNDSRVKHSSGFLKRADARNSSEGVMFKMDDSMFQFGDISDTDDESDIEPLPSLATTETNTSEASFAQYLYIQMEYCEKSTLRNVIDEGLFKNQDRMWRLFREIVEGLSHVHSQGIIHRDLKPVNIFMDSRDQVKIGDFGLATSHTTGLLDQSMVSLSIASETKPSGDSSSRMTGKVGTYLYAAPEIDALSGKVKISERVDMYSLGIIFFEMCYKPLLTGMERVKVIGMLRTEKIILPEDFEDKPRHKEKKLLLWLLSHKSDERPTANELLESGLIPPKLEDRHFDELLALTLKQTSSTKYKRLTAAVFSQNPDPVTEQIYDMHVEQYKDGSLVMAHAYEYVESVLREILTRHGAVSQDIPLLLPKCCIFDEYDSIANVMDPEGIILSLPFDSRVSLARYIARNGVYNMKRYSIGKVYRDTKIHRAHPIEIKECSFDIICDSANSMLPDAEILYAVEEIVKYFPNIKHRNYYIRMNHTSLLKAILQQSNLSETRTDELYSILQYSKDTKECITKLKASLLDAEVPDHTVNKLLSYLDFEGPVNKAREALQSLRKARGPVGVFAKQAFNDLLAVVRNLKLLGLEMPIYVQTSLAYNVNIFSGIVFQFVAENRRKRKHGGVDILAAGGRYDRLIEAFKRPNDCKHFPRAVGVSIAVEKIVNSVLLDAQDNESISPYLNECDVLVGVVGESSLLEQRLTAVRELWGAGIRAKLSSYDTRHDGNLEALQEYCREAGINNLLLLKEAEADYVRIRTRDKEKFVENKVGRSAMCEYLQMILSEAKDKEVNVPGQKMQSIPQTSSSDSSLINTTFLIQDKLSKRRIESQILSKLSNVIHQSFLKTPVEVVVVDLPLNSLKIVFSYLEIDAEEDEFEASVSDIIDRQKQKKSMQYIHRVCSTLREIKIERKFVVLYGYKDDFYRIFL